MDNYIYDAKERKRLYDDLLNDKVFLDLAEMIGLLEMEIKETSENTIGEYHENLYYCAFLISRMGLLHNVYRIWTAKNLNFDTFRGLDVQCLVGAGVEETLDYLNQKGDDVSNEISDYIIKCRDVGDFDDLEKWKEFRTKYYGSMRD